MIHHCNLPSNIRFGDIKICMIRLFIDRYFSLNMTLIDYGIKRWLNFYAFEFSWLI